SFAIDFSPDGKLLAAGRPDGTICVYDVGSGGIRQRFSIDVQATMLRFDPRGLSLAIASARDHVVQVRDLRSAAVLRSFEYPDGIRGVAWSPDGGTLAAGCDDCRIYLRDITAGRDQVVLLGHRSSAVSVAFNRSGDRLVSCGWDGIGRFWEISTGRELLCVPCTGLRMSRDDRRCASFTGPTSPRVVCWDVVEGRELSILTAAPVHRSVMGMDLSPDGQMLAAWVNDGVIIWDVVRAAQAAFLPIPDLRSALFEPAGGALLATSGAGLCRWPMKCQTP